MSSSESPSPDSNSPEVLQPPDPLRLAGSDRTQQRKPGAFSATRWRQRRIGLGNWPALFLLPLLVAIVQSTAILPLYHLIFGQSFGITNGRDAPWIGGIAIVGLAGFYATIMLARFVTNDIAAQLIAFCLWLTTTLGWLATDSDYDVSGLIGDPWSLVSEHGYFVGFLFLTMGCWWQGIRYASDENLVNADEIRAMIQRCWGLLLGGIFFAAIIDNESADKAVAAARFAVPIAAIASLALIAAAETESTRQIARSRGAKGPQWDRWLRIVGSVTGVAAIVSVIIIVLLGPEALSAAIHGIAVVGRLVAIGLGYVLFAIFYLLYQVIRAVYYLLQMIFGDFDMEPMDVPQPPAGMSGLEPMPPGEEQEPWEQAELLRWIGLGIAIIIVALIIFRIKRRASRVVDAAVNDEERDSVFSSGLLKDQLKGLFRRRNRAEGIRTLDLTSEPGSIRETFLFLHVLATRQLVARREAETPDDFARRLRVAWPGTADSLRDLTNGYQRVRYGDIDDDPSNPDLPAARRAWHAIWERRKDWEPPGEDDD
jgi:hypothetical protein